MAPSPRAIVVLGCRVRPDGTPGTYLAARVATGVAALLQGRAAQLVLSGGRQWGHTPEWEAMEQLACTLGAPPEALVAEKTSHNTRDNALETRRLLGAHAHVLIVTQRFHAARALRLFRQAGLHPTWEPAPTPPTPPWNQLRLHAGEHVAALLDRVFR